jgi:hypothetical protein
MRDLYVNRLTAQRVARLDNLDALVSSMQTAAAAMAQYNALAQAVAVAQNAGSVWQTHVIGSPGAFSFTVPEGVHVLWFDICGGGGGGGGGGTFGNYSGGGAASLLDMMAVVEPGQVITGTIGGGGLVGSYATQTSGGIGAPSDISVGVQVNVSGGYGASVGNGTTFGGSGGIASNAPAAAVSGLLGGHAFGGSAGGGTNARGRCALGLRRRNNSGDGGTSLLPGSPGECVLRWLAPRVLS